MIIWIIIIALIVISLLALIFPTWVDDGLSGVRRRDKAMEALRKIADAGREEWK